MFKKKTGAMVLLFIFAFLLFGGTVVLAEAAEEIPLRERIMNPDLDGARMEDEIGTAADEFYAFIVRMAYILLPLAFLGAAGILITTKSAIKALSFVFLLAGVALVIFLAPEIVGGIISSIRNM